MIFRKFICTFGLVAVATLSAAAHAWGERGHDLITRVAVQKLRIDSENDQSLVHPFVLRDHMLGHLSNAPDIVWRADYMSDEAKSLNSATHYINLEKLVTGVKRWDDFPREFRKFQEMCESKGYQTSEVGTAPWRVLQLYKLIVRELTHLDAKPERMREMHINQALNYAGLMAHFVANLANPHNTTEKHDGRLTTNNDSHVNFESMVVAQLSFALPRKILKQSQKRRLWLRNYTKKERNEITKDPQKLVWALVADSHALVDNLAQFEDSHLIVSPNDINRAEVTRVVKKPSTKISRRYEKLLVKRMAIGVDVLARLWTLAWQDAGSPNMSGYQSNYYPVQPPFITPSYVEQN